jgi:hypothetical protein
MRKAQYFISIPAFALAISHMIWPKAINIDLNTLVLLIIAMIPWLIPILKSLELPGGFKIEFRDLQKAGTKAEQAGLVSKKGKIATEAKFHLEEVVDYDPNLALAGLRIEIEKKLQKLAEVNYIGFKQKGIFKLMKALTKKEVLTSDEASALSDLVGLLNKAVHGAEVEKQAANWAFDVGRRIVVGLEEKLKNQNNGKSVDN